MQVSISDIKANPSKYVTLADKQDIGITRNGRQVAELVSARPDKVTAMKGLFGIVPSDIDVCAERNERLGL